MGENCAAGNLAISLDELKKRYEKIKSKAEPIKLSQNGTFASRVYWCIENRLPLLYPDITYRKNKVNGYLKSIEIEWTPLDNDPAKTKEVKERKEKEYKKWILQRYFKNQEEKAELL